LVVVTGYSLLTFARSRNRNRRSNATVGLAQPEFRYKSAEGIIHTLG
jgi:hypothetical protein